MSKNSYYACHCWWVSVILNCIGDHRTLVVLVVSSIYEDIPCADVLLSLRLLRASNYVFSCLRSFILRKAVFFAANKNTNDIISFVVECFSVERPNSLPVVVATALGI